MLTASLNDTRVGFYQPAKYAARVRERQTNADGMVRKRSHIGRTANALKIVPAQVILQTNMEQGGHFDEGGRYQGSRGTALQYAFLYKALGLHNTFR